MEYLVGTGVPPGSVHAFAGGPEGGIGFILESPTSFPETLSLAWLDGAGHLTAGPFPIFETEIVADVRATSEPGGGCALLISSAPVGPAGGRVTFLRASLDGSVIQQTVLLDRIPTVPAVPVLRWHEEYFVAAWSYPLRMGSLVCAGVTP